MITKPPRRGPLNRAGHGPTKLSVTPHSQTLRPSGFGLFVSPSGLFAGLLAFFSVLFTYHEHII